MTQQIVPLFGTGNGVKSKWVSTQRRVNCYLESEPDQDKGPLALYTRPGLVPFTYSHTFSGSDSNSIYIPGPIRGFYVGAQGSTSYPSSPTSFIVEGNSIWQAFGQFAYQRVYDGNSLFPGQQPGLSTGPMLTSSGLVQIADNGFQIIVVDGAAVYCKRYAGGSTINQQGIVTSPPWSSAPTTCCYVAGRFIVNDPGNPGRFWYSAPFDGTSWPALQFATAEDNPDPLVSVHELNGTLVLIGTNTTEFWAASTSGTVAFQQVSGSTINWGTTAPFSVQNYQGGLMMLGRNLGGQRQVVMIQGYTPTVVSNPEVEYSINQQGTDGATACVMTVAGHAFYVLNLTNTSWAFDGQTGTWSEWQTNGSRWAGQFVAQNLAGPGQLVSDANSNSMYTLTPGYFLDGSLPILREVITRHIYNSYNLITVDKLTVDFQVGQQTIASTNGPPHVMLQVSKDNGNTWGNEMDMSLGAIGQMRQRVTWLRLGRGRDFTFRFRISDPVDMVITGGAIAAR